ncbi:MAG: hypothetical protein AW07_02512 [Candidatus Accumulibacter sp. SK-11]|nr:MAG: hypothetical protein AW07_02512 [Candidatus Accumulibacter sp. SK-11]
MLSPTPRGKASAGSRSSASTRRMVLASQKAAQIATENAARLPRLMDNRPSWNSCVRTVTSEVESGRYTRNDCSA